MTATKPTPILTVELEDWEGEQCALAVEHYAKKLKGEAEALKKLRRPAAIGEADFAASLADELCPQFRSIPEKGTAVFELELRYLDAVREGLVLLARALKSATGTLSPLGPDFTKTIERMKASANTIEANLAKKVDPQSDMFPDGEPEQPEDEVD